MLSPYKPLLVHRSGSIVFFSLPLRSQGVLKLSTSFWQGESKDGSGASFYKPLLVHLSSSIVFFASRLESQGVLKLSPGFWQPHDFSDESTIPSRKLELECIPMSFFDESTISSRKLELEWNHLTFFDDLASWGSFGSLYFLLFFFIISFTF